MREKSLPAATSTIPQRDFRRPNIAAANGLNYQTTVKAREISTSVCMRSSDANLRVRQSLHQQSRLDRQRQ